MPFLGEIKRRKVFQVAAVYAVVAWLLVQIVTAIEAPLSLPDWADTLVIILLAVGFPITLVMSWAYDLTSRGLVRDDGHAVVERSGGKTIEYVLIGLLVAAVGWVIYRVEFDAPGTSQAADREPLPNSVAVLPFSNLSPNEDDAYFAAGIHEEILNQLFKLSRLSVIARTSVLQYADTQKPISEIADELNVEAVMEGSVRYADGRVLITAQLIDPKTNLHLWSESYDRELADIFAIQADVAMNIANALAVEFSTSEQESIERVPTDSIEAYELYLAARPQLVGARRASEFLDAALELDPEFAQAWALKAIFHIANYTFVPADQVAAERDAALAAASRAIAIDPDLPEARSALAITQTQRAQWVEAESNFRRIRVGRTNSFGLARAAHLMAVGHHEAAAELAATLRRTDPLNPVTHSLFILSEALGGDLAGAEAASERARELFGDQEGNVRWFTVLSLLGTPSMTTRDEILPFGSIPVSNLAIENLDTPEAGIAALRARYDQEGATAPVVALLSYALWAAYLGDPEFAMDVMEVIVGQRAAVNTSVFWAPAMRDVRQLPRFRAYLRQIGIVDYWNQFGWPDFCRPTGGDDFECA